MHELKYIFFNLFILISVVSCNYDQTNPHIKIETQEGDIVIELYPEQAPITVANFLQYIDENRLKEATFYRTVTPDNQPDSDIKIEVIQGGLYEDEHPDMLPSILHETTKQTGILHKDGVISMARYGPGSATSEFFICIGDQSALDYGGMRNGDGVGFAAFGKVIEGMDVVRKIQNLPADGQYLKPRLKISSVERID